MRPKGIIPPNFIDLTGKRYGKLTVIGLDRNHHRTDTSWLCECDCGNTKSVSGARLRSGKVTSCGCEPNGRVLAGRRRMIDLTGKRFGMLTVLELDHYEKCRTYNEYWWKCKCDCGNICVKRGSLMKKGQTTSCGCYGQEKWENQLGRINEYTTSHGDSYTRLYRIYGHMIERCYNPHVRAYPEYGGRGIYICEEWYNPNLYGWEKHKAGNPGWVAFRDWSYANGFVDQPKDTPRSDILSIDRIDVNGPYAPWNCRWITMAEQATNKRTTVWVSYHGESYRFVEILHAFGIVNADEYNSVYAKVIYQKWPIDAAIYHMRHFDMGIFRDCGVFRDKDGFLVMIPSLKLQYERYLREKAD